MIQGNFIIESDTVFTNQIQMVDSFSSTLVIDHVDFTNISLSSTGIKATTSNITVESSSATLIDLSGTLSYSFITASLGSQVTINGFIFTNNTVPLLTGISSALDLSSLTVSNVNATGNILNIDEW
jgi:hypothetical protein